MKELFTSVLVVLLMGSVLLTGESPLLTKEQAEQDALKAVGEGAAVSALKEKQLDKIVWTVDVAGATRDFEVWIDAHTGATVKVFAEPMGQRAGHINEQQAEQAAIGVTHGGTVVQTQIERWNGYRAWDVTVTQPEFEYDVHVDARSAAVLASVKRMHPPLTNQGFITKVEAVQRAMDAIGGGKLLLIGLETNDDSREWSVDLKAKNGTEYEAKVNAYTGGVIALKAGG